jgi:hypothetical protein
LRLYLNAEGDRRVSSENAESHVEPPSLGYSDLVLKTARSVSEKGPADTVAHRDLLHSSPIFGVECVHRRDCDGEDFQGHGFGDSAYPQAEPLDGLLRRPLVVYLYLVSSVRVGLCCGSVTNINPICYEHELLSST